MSNVNSTAARAGTKAAVVPPQRPRRSDPPVGPVMIAIQGVLRKRDRAPKDDVECAQIARRIITAYGGEAKLRRLVVLMEGGTSCSQIAEEFGVTRQRAQQWQAALGERQTTFSARPILRKILVDA